MAAALLSLPVLLTAGWLVGGWAAFTLLLSVAVVGSYAPAAVHVWRSPDLTGVSAAAWLLLLVEAVGWGVFGWVNTSFTVTLYGVLASAGSVAVLTGWARWRLRAGMAGSAADAFLELAGDVADEDADGEHGDASAAEPVPDQVAQHRHGDDHDGDLEGAGAARTRRCHGRHRAGQPVAAVAGCE